MQPKSYKPASNPHAGDVGIAMDHIQEKKSCVQHLARNATTVAAPITLPMHASKRRTLNNIQFTQ
jgi:hypothetical protein